MTKDEAWQIVKDAKGWNTSYIGMNAQEREIADARRAAILKAWQVIGELDAADARTRQAVASGRDPVMFNMAIREFAR